MTRRAMAAAVGLFLAAGLAVPAATAQETAVGVVATIPAEPAEDSAALEPVEPAAPAVDRAILQGLDKITARISTFDAPIGEIAKFGSLQITARICDKRPPEEPPEAAAFLEVVDVRPDSPAVAVFTGWMFASSPALSAMEHAVYDVWVIDCKKASSSASEVSAAN